MLDFVKQGGGSLTEDVLCRERWKGSGESWAGAEKAEAQITGGSALIMTKTT